MKSKGIRLKMWEDSEGIGGGTERWGRRKRENNEEGMRIMKIIIEMNWFVPAGRMNKQKERAYIRHKTGPTLRRLCRFIYYVG